MQNQNSALLWLNDRVGTIVAITVERAIGDLSTAVFTADGELRHWTSTTARANLDLRDELRGRYDLVGEGGEVKVTLDLSDIDRSDIDFGDVDVYDNDTLVIQLAENVRIEVVECAPITRNEEPDEQPE